jgi:hypothetical protein
MHEIVVNLHIHTLYSDGTGLHGDIARAALRCGLDSVIVTDHNVWATGVDRYVHEDGKRVLLLAAEEIHDRSRVSQKDHLLVLGARKDLAPLGEDMTALLDAVRRNGGQAFIAHLVDPPAPAFDEPGISWENWSVTGFAGIEIWNGFSELKAHLHTWLHGLIYAFLPALVAHGALPSAIERWDHLLLKHPTAAIGGSDAHALHRRTGLLRCTVFPYDYHFRALNTHVLLKAPLTGDVDADADTIYTALAAGSCFIGYDLPQPTKGFRFTARAGDTETSMGECITTRRGVTLQAELPAPAEIRLLKDGHPVHTIADGRALTWVSSEPGTYRIEAYRRYLGRRRTWILSNPIYVHQSAV